MSNPWAGWSVTCSWACHVAARNSDLGTDFACPVGTPIVAAFPGTLSNGIRPEPAPFKGLYIAILRSDEFPNLSFEHMHLSRFQTPGHYNAGDTIGWSGGARYALGSGQATGPHLHVNAIISGQLQPIFTAFTEFASIDVRPLPPTPIGRPDMTTIFNLQGATPPLFAMAGDAGTGGPGNWLEIGDLGLATKLAAIHNTGFSNSSVELSAGTWDLWKAAYLTPVTVTAPSAPAAPSSAVLDALNLINTTLTGLHIPTKITGTLG